MTHTAQPARTLHRHLPFLHLPLMCYRDSVDTTEPDGGLREHVGLAKYSLRLQRYWWAARAIQGIAAQRPDGIVVVDMGCEQGWMKRFVGDAHTITWIGIDGNTEHPSLGASGYDRLETCNFHERLPLEDGIADVVVCLHVFEHLRGPALAAAEVARILKPGGVFLAGTPVAPAPVAYVRTRMLEARDRAGRNRHWGHLRKFSPGAWRRLCAGAGLTVEFATGSHLIRRSGSPLENHRWWVRANQLWGGLFPSLGQEIYLAARKPR